MLRVFTGIGSIVVFFILTILTLGYLAPVEYEGGISEFFIDRRPIIWQALTHIESIPKVKPDVDSIEITENNRGLITWTEYLGGDKFRTYRIVEKREPYKYVVNLFDSSNKITGTWTFILTQTQNGTVVKVEEVSKNENVWLRGWHTILGGDVRLKREMKVLRVALFRRLIDTP